MGRGKNINIFLMDGEANGRIKCSLANWTGVAYKIPRSMLDKVKNITYLNQTGVYFLFGKSEETDDNIVYIGQAGIRKNGMGLLYRLEEHRRSSEMDYWNEAVVFTTSNNSFRPTEISYLENKFHTLTVNARRYLVKNSNMPMQGNVTEEKESELDEYIDYAKLVMAALGYKLFEPVDPGKKSNDIEKDANEEHPLLYYNSNRVSATGRITTEGFVVLSGSRISLEIVKSCPAHVLKMRDDHKNKISFDGLLLSDILFSTPSTAAGFVSGSSVNGLIVWKNEKGQTIKELEAQKN